MAIPATFTVKRNRALPGTLGDTSLYNIDGTCAAGGDIPVGVAVSVTDVDEMGHKGVAVTAASTVPYGVAYHSHAYCPTGTYAEGDEVNVMTHGRIWMITDDTSSPAFGTAVKVVAGTGHAAAAGTLATSWTYTGEFEKTKAGVNLVKVQILQLAAPAAAGGGE